MQLIAEFEVCGNAFLIPNPSFP